MGQTGWPLVGNERMDPYYTSSHGSVEYGFLEDEFSLQTGHFPPPWLLEKEFVYQKRPPSSKLSQKTCHFCKLMSFWGIQGPYLGSHHQRLLGKTLAPRCHPLLPSEHWSGGGLRAWGKSSLVMVDFGGTTYMVVSKNSGFSPQIIHFNRVFHDKPSILETSIFRRWLTSTTWHLKVLNFKTSKGWRGFREATRKIWWFMVHCKPLRKTRIHPREILGTTNSGTPIPILLPYFRGFLEKSLIHTQNTGIQGFPSDASQI